MSTPYASTLHASEELVSLVQEMERRGYDVAAIVRAVEKPWKWMHESLHLRECIHDTSQCEFCKEE